MSNLIDVILLLFKNNESRFIKLLNMSDLIDVILLLFKNSRYKRGRLLKVLSSITDMSLYCNSNRTRFVKLLNVSDLIDVILLLFKYSRYKRGRLLKVLSSITDMLLYCNCKSYVLLGKSVGILSSPLLEQLTLTPFELLVQLQTLGQDDTTPTNKITATIAVIRNCILCRQSQKCYCL